MSTIDNQAGEGLSLPVPSGEGLRVAIVVAAWNSNITEPLVQGALEVLERYHTAHVSIVRVAGAFELINASARMQQSEEAFDAVIAIGCVVRGDTPHFDYICQGVSVGLAQLNTTPRKSDGALIPVIFGVLTTNTMEQAEDRAGGKLGNKGAEAAEVALQMARL